MAARQDFERDVARQEGQRRLRLEVDDEDDVVAASGETGGEPRPHPLRAAAGQRVDIEEKRARRGRPTSASNRAYRGVRHALETGRRRPATSRAAPMTAVRLLLPQGGLRRWHRLLVDRLVAQRHRALVEVRAAARGGAALDSADRGARGPDRATRRPAALDREPSGAWSAPDSGEADLVFDLTGSAEPEPGAIVPLYDGAAGDAARDAALLDHRAPWIELAAIGDDAPRVYAVGLAGAAATRPAVRRPRGGRRRADRADSPTRRARARRGLGAASAGCDAARRRHALRRGDAGRSDRTSLAPTGRARRSLADRRPASHARRGAVRRPRPISVIRAGAGSTDDRRRYFADPFLFEADGVAYVFCEEFPYATGKGVISVFALDADGTSRRAAESSWSGPITSPTPSSSATTARSG